MGSCLHLGSFSRLEVPWVPDDIISHQRRGFTLLYQRISMGAGPSAGLSTVCTEAIRGRGQRERPFLSSPPPQCSYNAHDLDIRA